MTAAKMYKWNGSVKRRIYLRFEKFPAPWQFYSHFVIELGQKIQDKEAEALFQLLQLNHQRVADSLGQLPWLTYDSRFRNSSTLEKRI